MQDVVDDGEWKVLEDRQLGSSLFRRRRRQWWHRSTFGDNFKTIARNATTRSDAKFGAKKKVRKKKAPSWHQASSIVSTSSLQF